MVKNLYFLDNGWLLLQEKLIWMEDYLKKCPLKDTHPVKMNLNKRFFPGKKSVQTIIFGAQGFRITIN